MNWFKRIFHKKPQRLVLVHCSGGDIVLPVSKNNIIQVPWFLSTCPFKLEPEGKVSLQLMWGKDTPAKGYGKIWDSITWEELKSEEQKH